MKLWLKLTIIFSSIIVGIGVIFGGAIGYFRLPVMGYYRASQKAFVIPDYNHGYIAQGLCYSSSEQVFLLSGYMNDKSPSPIYVINKNGEYQKKVTLLTKDGKDYNGHFGGIDVFGDFIYVADGNGLLIYDFSKLISAKDGDKLELLGEFSTEKSENDYIKISFVTVSESSLFVGEFYRAGNYPTLDSHKLTTLNGDYNQALCVEYNLDGSYEFGISPTPVNAYSLPDQVQGLTVYDGKFYLSTSWGIGFSHILEYDKAKLARQNDITVLGQNLPLYALDGASLTKDYKIPPMSEEIVFVDGLLYVNCESASNKYIFGKFTGGKYLYKTNLSLIG